MKLPAPLFTAQIFVPGGGGGESFFFFFSTFFFFLAGVVRRSAKPSQRFRLPLELIGRDVYTQLNVYRAHPPFQVIRPADADLLAVYARRVYSRCKKNTACGRRDEELHQNERFGFTSASARRSRQPQSSQCLQTLLEGGQPRVYGGASVRSTWLPAEIQLFILDLFSTFISCSLCS